MATQYWREVSNILLHDFHETSPNLIAKIANHAEENTFYRFIDLTKSRVTRITSLICQHHQIRGHIAAENKFGGFFQFERLD